MTQSPRVALAGVARTTTVRTSAPAVSQALGVGLLLLAALFWGSGNVASKTVLDHIGPMTTLALRVLIAAVILLPLLVREGPLPRNPEWWISALRVGALFVLAAMFQQAAYQWTTVTNASFLVNSSAVLTPILAWVLLRHRPVPRIIVAGMATITGAWLMSGMPVGFETINLGDAACIASALFYAGWALALGHHAMRHGSPVGLTLVQFALTAVVLLPPALLIEQPTLPAIMAAWPEILYLAVFSTAGACILTTIAQRRVTASVAVVILSTESIFGMLGAVLLLAEVVTPAALVGGALILTATIIAVGPDRAALRRVGARRQ